MPSLVRRAPSQRLQRASGLLATIVVIVVVELVARASIRTPNLSVLLLMTVLFATFSGGVRSGLAAGALALVYYAFYESIPGQPFRYTVGDLERVVTTAGACVVGVVLLARLHVQIARLLAREQSLRKEAETVGSRSVEIMESVTDGFFALDRDYCYTYVNRKAEQIVRRSREELLGRCVWEVFPALVGSAWEREFRRAVAEQVTVHFEEYYAPLDAWFETHAYPSPNGLTIYLTDVTTRKRAEGALATRLGQQASVAMLGQQALSAADLTTLLEAAVRTVASRLGVEMAKVLELSADGQSLLLRAGVGWKKERAKAVLTVDQGSQAGYTLLSNSAVIVEDLRTEVRFRGPSLLLEHEVVSGMSVVIAGPGRPYGVLGAHTKRSQRFTADDVNFLQAVANVIAQAVQRCSVVQELTKSEARFRLLAETVHDAFFIVDPKTGQNEYVSPAYAQIWGRPYDPSGPSWLETIHPDDRAALAGELERDRLAPSHEYRILRPDGSIRWVSFQAFPVPVADASARRVVWVARDVSERRQAEEVARCMQEEQVARMTAEAGLRARDDVLALVSHDLRSPLATIVMSADLLAQSTDEPTAIRRLGVIGRAATRMSRLVEDLLDVARIEAGKMTLRVEPMEVAALFSEVREAVEAPALERGVRLDIDSALDIPRVGGDRDRILRVILNLVGNAIKFTPPHGCVSLRAEHSGDHVIVSVSDSGKGIAADDRPFLFRPFWQGRSSDPRGAGLGLSIVRGIIEAHQERIWVTDADGGGARFSFSLSPASGTSTAPSSHDVS